MSQENVEVVRRALAEFEQGKFWVPEFFDPSIRVRWLDVAGEKSETVGLQAMRTFLINWFRTFESLLISPKRVIDAGDQVVVIAAWRGRGKSSGAYTEWLHGQVWTLRDGKAISVIAYEDPDEALEAAGLRE